MPCCTRSITGVYLNSLVSVIDKTNLTLVDCCDKILFNSSWKTLLSSPKARLITFFKTQDSFNIFFFFKSHNIPYFQCYTAITNFLISNTCEIRFHDVIGQSTVPMYSYAKILKHGRPT